MNSMCSSLMQQSSRAKTWKDLPHVQGPLTYSGQTRSQGQAEAGGLGSVKMSPREVNSGMMVSGDY